VEIAALRERPKVSGPVTTPSGAVLDAIRRGLGDVDTDGRAARVWFRATDRPGGIADHKADGWAVYVEGPDIEFTLWVSARDDDAEIAAHIADSLQDYFGADDDSGSWQPVCPLHGHPASAEVLNNEAVWCCTRSCDEWSARVGDLGTPPRLDAADDPHRGHYELLIRWP
jgi:hypothetical protein